jgi:hypothetical protein
VPTLAYDLDMASFFNPKSKIQNSVIFPLLFSIQNLKSKIQNPVSSSQKKYEGPARFVQAI